MQAWEFLGCISKMGNVPLYQHSDEAGEEPRWWYAKIRPAALNHRTANSEGIRSTGLHNAKPPRQTCALRRSGMPTPQPQPQPIAQSAVPSPQSAVRMGLDGKEPARVMSCYSLKSGLSSNSGLCLSITTRLKLRLNRGCAVLVFK
ncbi:hypothetical protein I7I51_06786 [Histoplasma capsulatum]|uniref:Uncharacterized protein n=1 Tax=Ajellomyces capsulatus TaxID=5037 RepID=A0A8A1MJ77_AJECA|nr:hypothetical protein I7I51_06786 [Histoplasma capsulatum]